MATKAVTEDIIEQAREAGVRRLAATAVLAKQEASKSIAQSLVGVCKLRPEELPKTHNAPDWLYSLAHGIDLGARDGYPKDADFWTWRNKIDERIRTWDEADHEALIRRMSEIGVARGSVPLDVAASVEHWSRDWQTIYAGRAALIEKGMARRLAQAQAEAERQRRGTIEAIEENNAVLSDEDIAELAHGGVW